MAKISSRKCQDLFENGLTDFVISQKSLILSGVSERSLCTQLAMSLKDELKVVGVIGYYVDTEYNRKQNKELKTIIDNVGRIVRITSDLIVHTRGEKVKDDNLIAIEMKKADAPGSEKAADKIRLKAMTMRSFDDTWVADGITPPEHVCGYTLGVFLEIDSVRCAGSGEFYSLGKCIKKFNFLF